MVVDAARLMIATEHEKILRITNLGKSWKQKNEMKWKMNLCEFFKPCKQTWTIWPQRIADLDRRNHPGTDKYADLGIPHCSLSESDRWIAHADHHTQWRALGFGGTPVVTQTHFWRRKAVLELPLNKIFVINKKKACRVWNLLLREYCPGWSGPQWVYQTIGQWIRWQHLRQISDPLLQQFLLLSVVVVVEKLVVDEELSCLCICCVIDWLNSGRIIKAVRIEKGKSNLKVI